jgi:hypothetical protein
MLSSQLEQQERRETLRNDRRIREQGSTYLAQTHSDLGGRYAQIQPERVVGATEQPYSSLPKMPEGNPWAGPDLVGDEPPLSAYDNPALELSAPSVSQGPTGDPTTTPLAAVGPPLSHSRTYRRY